MFAEPLRFSLDLAVGSDTFRIPGGDIRAVELDLRPYGFTGRVDFRIHADAARDQWLPAFLGTDGIQVRLAVGAAYPAGASMNPAVTVTGRVTARSLREETFAEAAGQPVLLREYRLDFQDPAQALWRQHFPMALYADGTMADLIKAQLADGMSLVLDWDVLERDLPVLFMGLGADEKRASFYDFLMWYVDAQGGVWSFDYAGNTYRLSAGKAAAGTAQPLPRDQVEDFRVHLPEPSRADAYILNAGSEAPMRRELPPNPAALGMRRDILVRTSIPDRVLARADRESARRGARKPELTVRFRRFPALSLYPGALIAPDRPSWSAKLYPAGKQYRIRRLRLRARELDGDSDAGRHADLAGYRIELGADLESSDDPVAILPPYRPPAYPVQVEGKLRCDAGKTGERTYIVYSDPKTSEDFYQVHVPLWNQDIQVPFAPHPFTGQFYVPAYKEERVLLALYFDRAEILRFLDWCEGARLSADGQGNRMLWGRSGTSQTAVQHVYSDGQPEFSLTRTSGGDTELVKFGDGVTLLQVQEEDGAELTEERYDLTPKVEDAKAQLSMATRTAIADASDSFGQSMGELNGRLDTATAGTRGKLDAMEAEVNAKAEEIGTAVQAALQQLAERGDALRENIASAKTELQNSTQL